MLYERQDELKYNLIHWHNWTTLMAHILDHNTEPFIFFYERSIWHQAKEPVWEHTWIYVLKDTGHWKKN